MPASWARLDAIGCVRLTAVSGESLWGRRTIGTSPHMLASGGLAIFGGSRHDETKPTGTGSFIWFGEYV